MFALGGKNISMYLAVTPKLMNGNLQKHCHVNTKERKPEAWTSAAWTQTPSLDYIGFNGILIDWGEKLNWS